MPIENQLKVLKLKNLSTATTTFENASSQLNLFRHQIENAVFELADCDEIPDDINKQYRDIELTMYNLQKWVDEMTGLAKSKKRKVESELLGLVMEKESEK